MFTLIPSKEDQKAMRYWMRNWYKSHQDGVVYRNTAWAPISLETPLPACMQNRSQIKTRPRPMTEAEKTAIIRLTGSTPLFDRLFIPCQRGRSRSQVGRKVKA